MKSDRFVEEVLVIGAWFNWRFGFGRGSWDLIIGTRGTVATLGKRQDAGLRKRSQRLRLTGAGALVLGLGLWLNVLFVNNKNLKG